MSYRTNNALNLGRLANKYRLLLLLCLLVFFVIFSPIVELASLGRGWLTIAFLVVVVASVNTSGKPSLMTFSAVVFGIATAIFWLARLGTDSHWVGIAADLSGTCIMGFTTLVVLRTVLVSRASNFNALCGAAAVYLLFGLTWAISFELIEAISQGSFEGLSRDPVERWNQLIYFSLTTLTTLGYGDINPVNPFARLWSTLEAVAGVLYLAILVARLVTIYRDDSATGQR